ncbi:MAG: PAS domain S-box protein, partial [Desulfuromonadales bacterium]|nr:PAS domain S-box protein [Desulfuromonadales bacterium]
IHNYLARVNDEGAVNNFEMEVRRRDGRVRIGLVSARTLQLGEEPCRMVVIRDITAMKDAERRALRSESRFRSLVSVMGEGVLILSKDGDIIQSNQAAEKILDVSREEMLDRDYLDVVPEVIHEDGRPCSLDERPTSVTLQTGEPVVNQVFGFNAKSGKTVWLQFNTHALGVDSKGKPQAMVISFADVTRLKQIENDLRRNEQHLRTVSQQLQGLLRAIPDRIMVLDRNMRVVWLNWVERERETLLDDAEAYEGRLCYKIDMMHCGRAGEEADDVCGFARCPVQKCFRSGHPEILQKSMSDGRTLQLRAFPVNDEQGDIINVIEIVQDITEELRAQEQNVRTGQLAALGELAAGVAHEINNPINGVINYAQLILNKAEETSREQELSQRIIREGERIAVIVRELLFFAREESQEVHQVTVLSVLEEVLTLTRNQIRKESIKMQVDLPDDLPPIDSRSHQIQQLFLNLISNARHALSEKYPSKDPNKILRVSAEPIERESQNFVRICFRDHGTGIPPELLPRVLNPFVTTKPSGVGTGLGLSISHEIVQKHGGTLTIGSEEGEYTELIVELPASKVVDSELEGM